MAPGFAEGVAMLREIPKVIEDQDKAQALLFMYNRGTMRGIQYRRCDLIQPDVCIEGGDTW